MLTYDIKNISRWYLIDFTNCYTKKKSFLVRMKNAFHAESNLLMENECEEKLIKALKLSYKSTLSFLNSLYAILKELPISLRYCFSPFMWKKSIFHNQEFRFATLYQDVFRRHNQIILTFSQMQHYWSKALIFILPCLIIFLFILLYY